MWRLYERVLLFQVRNLYLYLGTILKMSNIWDWFLVCSGMPTKLAHISNQINLSDCKLEYWEKAWKLCPNCIIEMSVGSLLQVIYIRLLCLRNVPYFIISIANIHIGFDYNGMVTPTCYIHHTRNNMGILLQKCGTQPTLITMSPTTTVKFRWLCFVHVYVIANVKHHITISLVTSYNVVKSKQMNRHIQ